MKVNAVRLHTLLDGIHLAMCGTNKNSVMLKEVKSCFVKTIRYICVFVKIAINYQFQSVSRHCANAFALAEGGILVQNDRSQLISFPPLQKGNWLM